MVNWVNRPQADTNTKPCKCYITGCCIRLLVGGRISCKPARQMWYPSTINMIDTSRYITSTCFCLYCVLTKILYFCLINHLHVSNKSEIPQFRNKNCFIKHFEQTSAAKKHMPTHPQHSNIHVHNYMPIDKLPGHHWYILTL